MCTKKFEKSVGKPAHGRERVKDLNPNPVNSFRIEQKGPGSAALVFPLHFVSVFDLINPGGQRVPLPVREVAKTGLFRIAQLTETQVRSLFPYYSFVTTFFLLPSRL